MASESGRYDRAEDLGGLVFSLAGLAVAWTFWQRVVPAEGDWTHGQRLTLGLPWVALIIVAGFVAGAWITSRVSWLRRMLATDREMREEVERRAREAFSRFRVTRTQQGTGILIYVSLFGRMVSVLGDEPIARRLDQKAWDRIKDVLTAGMRQKQAGEAFCQAIALCGELLAQHFPRREGDADELPNELRIMS